MDSPDQPVVERMARMRKAWQWLAILTVSALFAGALELAALPAALLIGPMLAAIVAGTNGATVRVPRLLFGAAQAIVGCLVASSISADNKRARRAAAALPAHKVTRRAARSRAAWESRKCAAESAAA